jgi:hypothetical protein
MCYKFLPPYSPDYNPIEVISAIKAYICRHGNLVCVAMSGHNEIEAYVCLHEAVWSVTPENAEGWFGDCGY